MRARHKFKAKPTQEDGFHFASQLECAYYNNLKLLMRTGEVLFFLRQVPFHLPGGVKYVVDFQVFYADGFVDFIDVKGMETAEFIMKKKIVESIYPIKINVIKRENFKRAQRI